MKTAMQELILKLPNEFIADNPSIILELLEKEKEEIIDAHINGQSNYHFSLESRTEEAEQYYNQTYNQNK